MNDSRGDATCQSIRYQWITQLLCAVLGAIFLAAGIVKGLQPVLFLQQIKAYGIVSDPTTIALLAWGLIVLECGFGAALFVRYHIQITLVLLFFLLVVFISLSFWAWRAIGLEDCGCFGSILNRGPVQAIVEDLFMLAAVAIIWVKRRHLIRAPSIIRSGSVLIVVIVSAILPFHYGLISPSIDPGDKGIHANHSDAIDSELGKLLSDTRGSYMVVLMDTECLHCQESVPYLNLIAEDSQSLKVIAVCANDEEDRRHFVEAFNPIYPIKQISQDDFWLWVGEGRVPRFILVRNLQIVRIWNEQLPDLDAILKILSV